MKFTRISERQVYDDIVSQTEFFREKTNFDPYIYSVLERKNVDISKAINAGIGLIDQGVIQGTIVVEGRRVIFFELGIDSKQILTWEDISSDIRTKEDPKNSKVDFRNPITMALYYYDEINS